MPRTDGLQYGYNAAGNHGYADEAPGTMRVYGGAEHVYDYCRKYKRDEKNKNMLQPERHDYTQRRAFVQSI